MSTPPTISPIPFMAAYGLADCAARCFAHFHPAKNPPAPMIGDAEVDATSARGNAAVRRGNRMFRREPVLALRHLWQTGDASQRATVAARVTVWLGRPAAEVRERVFVREQGRGTRG